MNVVIKVENLSKQYRLGEIGTGSLTHDINRWWHTVRGKEDPYLTVGEENDRTKKGNSDYVWSLKNINFEINQGDAIGIIGKNGAGKSTLLKILSRVTAPTTGKIFTKGRIASLLEVGTGFHPELSGRDNIFLNGAILGMRKHEISRKLEEIVDFSGVEKYIDTPVKRYSSGMYVRLAFAVAAHLDSEILIVDEVLAVGDADFQKKCLGKMNSISKGEGRTVLFVSHNMTSIQKLCSKGLLLNNGGVKLNGPINSVIEEYLAINGSRTRFESENDTNLEACILSAEIRDELNNVTNDIPIGRRWKIIVRYRVNKPINNFVCAIGISNVYDVALNTSWQNPLNVEPGIYEAEFSEDVIDYSVGSYRIHIGISELKRSIQFLEGALELNIVAVVDKVHDSLLFYEASTNAILNPMTMHTNKIEGTKNIEKVQGMNSN